MRTPWGEVQRRPHSVGVLVFVLVAAGCGPLIQAQVANSIPAFEVASIKPHDPNNPMSMTWIGDPDRITETNVSVKALIEFAYDIGDNQLSGGPSWISSERYDIVGKTPETVIANEAAMHASQPYKVEQIRLMFQSLLRDRFQLNIDQSTQTMPMLALSVSGSGAKLPPPSGRSGVQMSPNGFTCYGCRIKNLVDLLQRGLNRRVIDKTDLTGVYDFVLTWRDEPTSTDAPRGGAVDFADAVTMFDDVLQDQVGLKLAIQQLPSPTIKVLSVEKPSPN